MDGVGKSLILTLTRPTHRGGGYEICHTDFTFTQFKVIDEFYILEGAQWAKLKMFARSKFKMDHKRA